MRVCPSCKRDVATVGAFCPHCGAALPSADRRSTDADLTTPDSRPSSSSSSSSSSLHGRFDPGTRLGSRYRVVGLLGRGGMGEVYRADDLELNQPVALKFLPEAVARNPADLARLRQEVRIARQIAHPNVCRTYDISEADGQIFVVMEYVDGEDLASVLRRLGRPTHDKALEIARQLCLGIGAAHENGVLHRDLKPANIMIDGRGRVRITDFGLAGTVEELAAKSVIAGTPAYMAPEQQATGAATVQSDIFSLGLVLYELFTGKRATDIAPTADPTRPSDASRSDSSVRMPSSVVGDVDPAVERVILRCLERDPNRRPQSAYAVFGALPGGDPLAAAVAAGETPSPELVANAGVEGSIQPLHAGIAALVAVLSILGVSAIQTPLFQGLGKAPGVLSVRAEEVLTRVTGRPAPRYTSDGLRYAPPPAMSHADSLAAKKAGHKVKPAQPKQYWRRWSPMPFVPENLHSPRASMEDPPQAYPGSAKVVLDTSGRLLALDALPPSEADTTIGLANWAAVLDATGRDPAHAFAIPPPVFVTGGADTVVAWRVSGNAADTTSTSDTTLVAAAIRGHVVRVETYAGKNPLGKLAVLADPFKVNLPAWIDLMMYVAVPLIGSIFLARHNVRAKRGDVRGAIVVGVCITVFYLLEHLFATNVGESGLFDVLYLELGGNALAHGLLHATVMALAYLAIEPYIRRLWPSVLVSWARFVAGRFKDPIIGRDVLVGATAGAMLSLVSLGSGALERALALTDNAARLSPNLLDSMVSAPLILSQVSYAVAVSVLRATQLYTMLVILRVVLRSNKAAILGTTVLFAALSADYASRGWGLQLGTFLVLFSIALFIAFRFGYIAMITAWAFGTIMEGLAWSLSFNSWVAPQTLFAWAIVLAVLGYGFVTAVGGKSIFSDPLSDPVGARAPRR